MRILQVSNLYPPYWIGGYEQIAAWVATGLRERGHLVEVLTGRGAAFEGRPEIHGELDLDLAAIIAMSAGDGIRFPAGLGDSLSRHVFSRANLAASLRAIDRFGPDLVSFWNPAFISFAPLVAARRRGVPAVVHLSDAAANVFRNPHPPSVPRALRGVARAAVDALLRWSRPARFIVPSAFLKARVVGEGIPADRLDVLYWPVEPAVGRIAEPRSRGGAPRLLFVGALIPEKGPGVLIEALRRVASQRRDVSLTLVGEGPREYVASLRRAAEGLPVRFAGRLARPAVIDAYRSHHVLVFPSTWDEPFAVVPLEAMSAGLTVIATSTGGTPEAIVDGDTGLLVPPADPAALAHAILRILGDTELAHALAARGRAWARGRRGFDAFMERLAVVYAESAVPGARAA
jgi:glycosyltransferase involved in cell wall biosynthesis